MARYLQRQRIAAYVICQDDNERILLARFIGSGGSRLDDPHWTLPGGGLEHGEVPEVGALREFTEETGYDGRIDRLLGVDGVQGTSTWQLPAGYDGYDMHHLRIIYPDRSSAAS